MSNLTPELNLNLAVDDDDTADYLTIALSDTLTVLDGLFNSATGHAHNGSHQGGTLEFLDLTVGEDLTVIGQTELMGPALLHSNLHVIGTTTLDGATTIGSTLGVTGAVTLTAGLSVGTDLTVTRDLSVGRNAIVTGTLTAGAATVTGALTVGGSASITNLTATTVTLNGTITGTGTFNSGPRTSDWFRNTVSGSGIINTAVNIGVAFDGTGAYMYPSGDRVVSATATQTLSGKTFINAHDSGGSGVGVGGSDLTNYMINWGSGVFTLPTPSAAWAGVFRAVKAYGGAATVNCGGPLYGPGTSANGAVALNSGDSVTCWCDGSSWWVL